MVEKKIAVPVLVIVDTAGEISPAAFAWKGRIIRIRYVVRAYRCPAESVKTCRTRLFYCRTDYGYVYLHFYSDRWYVHKEISKDEQNRAGHTGDGKTEPKG